ncbi:hypothetical protein AMS68_001554 [Peltaster fructicola]|uniref:Chitobiosyldiphosphodolichol beta-mannosyltransferase n=1 Tax=Peltaster fructicola TaxID=286661 RepID=A0A6H0XMR4_9PEZI|nr:hypothetical protein AMS68_001554 [Peltaster fructicola]
MTALVTLWELIFAVAVLSTIFAVTFIITLPKSYVHFHPGHLTEADFSDEDRKEAGRSGYAYYQQHKDTSGHYATKTTVQIVVLGDIGRSPRMQYHALSLVKHGAAVQIVGYVESSPHPDVLASRFVKIVALEKTPSILQSGSSVLFLLTGPLKVVYQTWTLYKALAYRTTASRFMLVQNPPSIPVLAIAVFVCFVRNTKLVIDWHNFAYSILALRLGSDHVLVRLSHWYERIVSRGADSHFTVTDAMQRRVQKDFAIKAVTLHDRPAAQFQPLSAQQRLKFLGLCDVTSSYKQEIEEGKKKLIISSTSWTADEDFGVMLDALVAYSSSAEKNASLPSLLAVITGKGPQKQHYEAQIRNLERSGSLKGVVVRLAWLSIEDYASLLAAADLGICLHTSSSGVDLPMKVLDMFGAGLPVAGWSTYESWPELVHENENGLGFGSADGLHAILISLFGQSGHEKLEKLRQGALREGKYRWDDEWDKAALSVFNLAA